MLCCSGESLCPLVRLFCVCSVRADAGISFSLQRFRRVALLCAAVAVVACVAFFSSAHSTEPTELFFLTKKDADIAMEHLKAAGMGAEEPLPDHIKQLQVRRNAC